MPNVIDHANWISIFITLKVFVGLSKCLKFLKVFIAASLAGCLRFGLMCLKTFIHLGYVISKSLKSRPDFYHIS